MTNATPSIAATWPIGGGEMGAHIRALDWSKTPLGPIKGWPQCLRTAVDIMLASPVPTSIVWGREFVMLYNDANISNVGTLHPAMLGTRSEASLAEIWGEVSPLYDAVFAGETITLADRAWTYTREGRPVTKHFTTYISPIRDETGAVAGVLALSFETTGRVKAEAERRRAEDIWRTSEERLRRATEIETVGIVFFKVDGSINDSNEAFLRMSGYNREDLAAGLVRWDKMTPPEWMPHSLKAIDEFQSTGRTIPYEKEYIRKDGSRWWALFAATRLANGEGVEFIIDITESKQAEQRLREREMFISAVNDSVRALIAVIDLTTGKTIYANSYLQDLLGYTPEELYTKTPEELMEVAYPEDREAVVKLIRACRNAHSGERLSLEFRTRHKDGAYRWVRANGTPFGCRDASGAATQVLYVFEDITELKKSREEHERLEQYERKLLEFQVQSAGAALGRTKDELRALAASLMTAQEEVRRRIARELHDGVVQRVGLLQIELTTLSGRLPETAVDLQTGLQIQIDQAAAIAEELRDLSHRLHPSILDDLGLLPALASLSEDFKRAYGLTVRLDSQTESHSIPVGAANAAYRIVQEALQNTVKHAPNAAVELLVACSPDELRVVISDTGPGFDVEEARGKGRLGLISMQERAELAGGSAVIRSSKEGGTCIEVTFATRKLPE